MESENIQASIGIVTQESLESTRRMKQLCVESTEAGIATIVELDNQGEKLDNIEKGLRNIHEDMAEANHSLQKMGPWGFFKRGGRSRSKSPVFMMDNDDGKQSVRETLTNVSTSSGGQPHDGFISRYTHTSEEDEMEQNLQEVSNAIGNLHKMAIDIGCELDIQNPQIGKLISMTEENKARIEKANKKTKTLLK